MTRRKIEELAEHAAREIEADDAAEDTTPVEPIERMVDDD